MYQYHQPGIKNNIDPNHWKFLLILLKNWERISILCDLFIFYLIFISKLVINFVILCYFFSLPYGKIYKY
jgi:hypothetical protein